MRHVLLCYIAWYVIGFVSGPKRLILAGDMNHISSIKIVTAIFYFIKWIFALPGNYSRKETIQGQKLYEEVWYQVSKLSQYRWENFSYFWNRCCLLTWLIDMVSISRFIDSNPLMWLIYHVICIGSSLWGFAQNSELEKWKQKF